MSRPGKRHGLVCANASGILREFTIKRKKGYVCTIGTVLDRNPETVRCPNVMLFDDASHLEDIDKEYDSSPPLLAVIVLSPSDSHGKVTRICHDQMCLGTKMVWVLDSNAR